MFVSSEDKAQAQIVVPVVGRVVVPVRRAAVPRIVVPATAPVHTIGASTTLPFYNSIQERRNAIARA